MALPRVLTAALPLVLAAIGATVLSNSWVVLAAAVVILLAMTALVIWSVADAMRPPRHPSRTPERIRTSDPAAVDPVTARRRAA
jgi:hypothetical protein